MIKHVSYLTFMIQQIQDNIPMIKRRFRIRQLSRKKLGWLQTGKERWMQELDLSKMSTKIIGSGIIDIN